MKTARMSVFLFLAVALLVSVFLVATRNSDATCVDGTSNWTLSEAIKQDTAKLDSLLAHPHGPGFSDSVDNVIERAEKRKAKIDTYRKCLNLWSNK